MGPGRTSRLLQWMRHAISGRAIAMAVAMTWACTAPAQPSNEPVPAAPALVSLTPEEEAWRQAHPVVEVGVFAGDHMPLETWRGGQPEGLAVDYARLLAGRVGLQLHFRPYTDWTTLAFGDASRSVRYDLLLAQPVTEGRRARFHLLRPFLSGPPVLVARKGDLKIRSDADLDGARVIAERSFRQGAVDIARRWPRTTLVFADDGPQALAMLARGEADAYIGITASRTAALIARRQTDDVTMLGPVDLPVVSFAPAVPRDRGELAALLRRAEATVTQSDLDQLRARWGAQGDTGVSLRAAAGLTQAERAWLARLPTLRLGYEVDRYPYSFIDGQGRFDGLAADYVRILERRMGLRVQLVKADDWNSLQRMVLAREVDLVAAGSPNDIDPCEMGFSLPYEYFPEVIVARLQGPPIAGAQDLAGGTAAVREETAVIARLQAMLPDTRLVPVGSNESGLAMVAEGKADAYIGTLPAIDALIRNRYPAELRVVGPAGMDTELAIGVRREHQALLPLIDRVLGALDDGDRQAIRARWLTTDYVYGVPWRWVALGTAAVLLVLGGGTFAYIRLRRALRAQAVAERAAAAQLAFQQALLETIPYPVFVKDAEGRYLAVNRAYERAFACARADLLGHTVAQTRHLPGVDLDRIHAEDLRLAESRESARSELQLPQESAMDEPRSIILWRHPFSIDSDAGEVTRLLGTIVDVSEIRIAEARARASEQRLSDISQAMPAVVFQFRADATGSRRFTYVAGDVQGMVGMSGAELLQDENDALARVHPEDRERIVHSVEEVVATLQPMPAYDVRFLVRGQWRWLRTEGGVPRRLPDGSVEWSGYWIDTSRLHEQAQALGEAKAQAEAAVEARGIFLAAMSHEIRTPMTGVLGLIELLTHTRLDSEQANMTAMARDSARALLQILDDILDYSRIESGGLSIEEADFNLRDLLDSVAGLFAARAREAGIRFYSIVDWRVASAFRGDAMRVRQVLANLLSNALKFTARGHVALHVRLLDDADGRQKLRIEIVDTGIGIAADKLPRLFHPFIQAEDSTTRRFGGTGLGLSISRRLARMMGGELDLESETGKGTQALFDLTLPVVQAVAARPEFEGRTAVVCVGDGLRSQEISNGLSSFGFSLVEVEASDLGEYDADDADLFVVDAGVALPSALADAPLLQVAGMHERPGIAGMSQEYVLHGDPQSLQLLLANCQAALGLGDAGGAPPGPHDAAAQQARILVAEDHPINRAVIGRQLERLGYPYTMVSNGEEALAELARAKYDLLLTDCHMPVRDGYALTRQVRDTERGRDLHLPVIGLSASALPEEVQRGRDSGMDDFLAKPVQLDALAAKLAAFLHGGPGTRPVEAGAAVPGIDRLLALYRDPGQLRQVLHDLVDITRTELAELDVAMQNADTARQRELLHRMEGALSLVMAKPAPRNSSARDPQDRRNAIVEALVDIQAMLDAHQATPRERHAPS